MDLEGEQKPRRGGVEDAALEEAIASLLLRQEVAKVIYEMDIQCMTPKKIFHSVRLTYPDLENLFDLLEVNRSMVLDRVCTYFSHPDELGETVSDRIFVSFSPHFSAEESTLDAIITLDPEVGDLIQTMEDLSLPRNISTDYFQAVPKTGRKKGLWTRLRHFFLKA